MLRQRLTFPLLFTAILLYLFLSTNVLMHANNVMLLQTTLTEDFIDFNFYIKRH